MRPTSRTINKPASTAPRSTTSARSLTPNIQLNDERARPVTPEIVDDLASQLDNLVVTPPSAGSGRSRPRVDSVTTTPTPKKQGRKRREWPVKYDISVPTTEDEPDDD
jgi:hypothetical protein